MNHVSSKIFKKISYKAERLSENISFGETLGFNLQGKKKKS